MSEAHPGSPALTKIFQWAITIGTTIAKNTITGQQQLKNNAPALSIGILAFSRCFRVGLIQIDFRAVERSWSETSFCLFSSKPQPGRPGGTSFPSTTRGGSVHSGKNHGMYSTSVTIGRPQ